MEPALTGLGALPALALVALAFQPAVAVAQEALPLELEEVDLEAYPSVSLTLAAPPELAGAQLRAEQILVQEEGEFRTVTVERMPGDDLDVVLVIDTSGSMKGAPIEAAKAAAVGFLQQIPAQARVAVIGFGGTPELASPFSSDRSFLIAAVQGLEAQGETALYDALVTGVDELAGGSAKRKALIVLSDGGDTVSKSSLQDALGRVTGAVVDFHAVELQSPEYD
ncbi:MAG: vWA domain-containing protein, partial [Acidimicrobiia bacterium]